MYQRIMLKAHELAETLVNGNISDCVRGIAEEETKEGAALMALLVSDQLEGAQVKTLHRALERRI